MARMSDVILACALGATGAGAWALELPAPLGARFVVPATSMKEARFLRTAHQQYDFSCGSAAVATLLSHHYGDPVTERLVFERMYAAGDQQKIRREGFSLLDIKRFLEARGLHADGFELPLQKLVDGELPAIVLLSENGYHHFVVVKGVLGARVLIGDPAGGTRAIARASFDAMWRSKLLFVIHGRAGPTDRPAMAARFNDARDWAVAPAAPLTTAIGRSGLDLVTVPKNARGDF